MPTNAEFILEDMKMAYGNHPGLHVSCISRNKNNICKARYTHACKLIVWFEQTKDFFTSTDVNIGTTIAPTDTDTYRQVIFSSTAVPAVD